MEDFIKTTNKRLERDQNEVLKSSIDEPQTLIETNSNQWWIGPLDSNFKAIKKNLKY
jgi:hypothetical protein